MRKSCHALLFARPVGVACLMAAVPALPQARPHAVERQLSSKEQEWLMRHKDARDELGLSRLRWSDALMRDAQAWAGQLAARKAFHHDPDASKRGQGENLWMGSRQYFAPAQMIDGFLDEKRMFRPGVFPDVSTIGRWADVGHYTQITWPETEEVGSASALNARQEVLVCRYWPAGNVIGYRLDPRERSARR
jgi:hypothetical protein